jgi:hypothetical protein
MSSSLKNSLRDAVKRSLPAGLVRRARRKHEVTLWERSGRPVPPPEVIKRRILATYGSAFKTATLIETGTFLGDTVHALRHRFKAIFSIELSNELAAKAKHRFQGHSHIHILQGDSGEVLPQILSNISTRALFWLDGHYSGGVTAQGKLDTPVMKELRTILAHSVKDHVVLIDDARLFDGTNDYPAVEELRELLVSNRPDHSFSVSNDIIRFHPKKTVKSKF